MVEKYAAMYALLLLTANGHDHFIHSIITLTRHKNTPDAIPAQIRLGFVHSPFKVHRLKPEPETRWKPRTHLYITLPPTVSPPFVEYSA